LNAIAKWFSKNCGFLFDFYIIYSIIIIESEGKSMDDFVTNFSWEELEEEEWSIEDLENDYLTKEEN
jgi:hypothetical protein